MTLEPVIIFDLDGTLFDCNHRRHHIRNGNKDWKSFFATMHLDPVIEPIAELARIVGKSVKIICCSGRGEEHRQVSEDGLNRASIPWHKLYMRPLNDTRADHVIKLELLHQIRVDGFEPILVVDDRQSVVDMWRRNGLTCLQCTDWDETKSQANVSLDILVGPSGAGKTTYLEQSLRFGDYQPGAVISSDGLRFEMCGNFQDQSHNDDVFHAMHTLAKTRMALGLNVVLDATHIRTKDRVAAAKLGLPNAKVRYIVINRPLADKLATAGWRKDVKIGALSLIEKHEQVFQSNIKAIMAGDNLGVEVVDLRQK